MISPARPRSTPSGFTMTRVRSTRGRHYQHAQRLRPPAVSDRHPPREQPRRARRHAPRPPRRATPPRPRGRRRRPSPEPRRNASRTSGSSRTASPSARPASATAATGMARGDSGSQATTAVTPADASGANMADGSRPESMPTTATETPSTANSSVERVTERGHARRVVRAVDQQQRSAPQHLEAAGDPHRGQSLLHHGGGQRFAEERLHRGEGHGRVVALVGAVQRQQDVLVAPARGPQREQPPTHRHPVGGAAEVRPGHPDRRRARVARPAAQRRRPARAPSPPPRPGCPAR